MASLAPGAQTDVQSLNPSGDVPEVPSLNPSGDVPEVQSPNPSGDVPEVPSVDPSIDVDAEPCTKLDLLYIVDNSESMMEEQESLVRSFPAFIDRVQNLLPGTDVHIMVVDTDASSLPTYSSLSDLVNGNVSCDPNPSCCAEVCVLASIPFVDAFFSSCNGTNCADLSQLDWDDDACDEALGAGRRLSVDGEVCDVDNPGRYILGDQPDLAGKFSCVARAGTRGSVNGQPMGALLSALSATHNAPSGCNTGFLREDAVLAITIVTDEEDSRSPGDPEQWRQALLAAKGSNENAVVVLGLIGEDNGCPSAQPAPRLQQFVDSFRLGGRGSVCAADYGPFFEAATTAIATSCRESQNVAR